MKNSNSIIDEVSKIKVWRRGGQRAPHKPLLLLLMLGRYQSGAPRLIEYRSIEEDLHQLLKDFGPTTKVHHPEYPFWHMLSEGFWDLENVGIPATNIGRTSVSRKLLLKNNAKGGLKEEFFQQVHNPNVRQQLLREILESNFPDSIHEEILLSVGLEDMQASTRKRRDPGFRKEIMRAYQYCCAVCGFSGWIGEKPVGVEAAHIMWHQAGGPDINSNGLALCSLHHKLFDRGMMAVSEDYQILVSEFAHGTGEFDHMVTRFHGKSLQMAVRPDYYPQASYLNWHVREVFHSPSYDVIGCGD